MRRRGMTIIELLVAAAVATVVMAGLLQAIISLFSSFTYAMGANQTIVEAGDAANQIAAAVRRSAPCDPRSNCGDNPGSALAEASAEKIVFYLDSKGKKASYYNHLGQIIFQSPEAGISVVAEDGSFNLKFYKASDYNTTELDEFNPTKATLKDVIAIRVSVSTKTNNVQDTHSTLVRLRNSPFKI